MEEQETREEINRLYWESDASVTEIGDRLGISRRALYEGIEPRPAGVPCPECSAPLGFRNRTAAENREAECPECGRELEVPADDPESPGDGREPDAAQRARAASQLSPPRKVPPAGSAPVLAAALLVGLTLGALLASILRRK